jgi:hypothetical protein
MLRTRTGLSSNTWNLFEEFADPMAGIPRGFLPDTGPLLHVRPPTLGPAVRLETGFGTGDEIKVEI